VDLESLLGDHTVLSFVATTGRGFATYGILRAELQGGYFIGRGIECLPLYLTDVLLHLQQGGHLIFAGVER